MENAGKHLDFHIHLKKFMVKSFPHNTVEYNQERVSEINKGIEYYKSSQLPQSYQDIP